MSQRKIKHVATQHHNPETHRRNLADAVNSLINTVIPNSGVLRITGNFTADKTARTIYCDTTLVIMTVTLPAGEDFMQYRIINTGATAKNVTITPNGSELLLGSSSSQTLTPGNILVIEYELTEGWW